MAEQFPQCKGTQCSNGMQCVLKERCLYRSSADEAREVMAQEVKEYSGKIDGSGVKDVMKAPKTPINLMPPQFIEGVAEVLKHGAKHYAPNQWMNGMSWETVAGGIERHISAFRRGEEFDTGEKGSGLPHLWHAACGLMFLSWFAHGPNAEQYRQFDDRLFKSEPASTLKQPLKETK